MTHWNLSAFLYVLIVSQLLVLIWFWKREKLERKKKSKLQESAERILQKLCTVFKNFDNYRPSASNFKSFSRSLEQFFLTVGQNNFGNKIPFLPSGLKILQFGGFLFIGKYESFVQMFMMQNSAVPYRRIWIHTIYKFYVWS